MKNEQERHDNSLLASFLPREEPQATAVEVHLDETAAPTSKVKPADHKDAEHRN